MHGWIGCLTIAFTLMITTDRGQAQASPGDAPAASATRAPAVPSANPAQATGNPAPTAAVAVDSRARTYRSIGSTCTVLGALLTAAGVSIAAGRDHDENLDSTGSSGNAGGRPFPAEVTIAGIGVAGIIAGLFLTAEARKIEAASHSAAITPTVSESGVGVALSGRF